MELKIRTLTPLWTGGIDGKVDRIHETGILGSLRWWYEAIVRGLGGEACDPSAGTCRFDAEQYAKSRAADERQRLRAAGLCDVCQVFGATGWRRRFRVSVVEENVSNAQIQDKVALQHRQYTDNKGKPRPTWYFRDPTQPNTVPNTPKIGCFSLKVISLATDFPPEVIAGLIKFIADWAALGARAQMGFGVIKLDERVDTDPLCRWLAQVVGSNHYPHLPSLRNIFLVRIAPRENGAQFNERDTFNLKYDLRQQFTGQQNSDLRHFIMGTVKGERMAAKVKMSRPYNGGREMRVWGWIPEQAEVYSNTWNRDAVVEKIHQHLKTNYTLQVWREMDSPWDTVTPNNSDALAFLRSLLGLQEEDNDAA